MAKTITLNAKNLLKSKTLQARSLNDIVFHLAPKHTNDELIGILTKIEKPFSKSSVQWYASKARAGVRR